MKGTSTAQFACSDVMRLVDAFVDQELTPDTTLRVLGHTLNCGGCQESAGRIALLKSRVHDAMRRVAAPARFRQELKDAIRRNTC